MILGLVYSVKCYLENGKRMVRLEYPGVWLRSTNIARTQKVDKITVYTPATSLWIVTNATLVSLNNYAGSVAVGHYGYLGTCEERTNCPCPEDLVPWAHSPWQPNRPPK